MMKIEKKIDFSHNPFSMPQVDIKDFDKTDPLSILAYQYDLVCNGYELSSGAIRNHLPELMYKVFSKVGYSKEEVNSRFEGMIKAFHMALHHMEVWHQELIELLCCLQKKQI